MSFQLEMHHFLWISHQFWVSPLLTLRSACVLIERKFTAIFARRRSDPSVEFILCNTHTLWEVSAWEFLLQLGFALVLGDLQWAWCFALVLGAMRWCLVQTIASQILSSPPHQCTQTNRLPVWNFPWDHKTALRLLVVRAEFSPTLLHSSSSW